jgi:hypothetical protein
MADGFDIHIDHEQAARLEAAADLLGLSAAEYGAYLIKAGLDAKTGFPIRTINPDPAIDHAIIEEAIRTGTMVPWAEFREELRRFGGRKG